MTYLHDEKTGTNLRISNAELEEAFNDIINNDDDAKFKKLLSRADTLMKEEHRKKKARERKARNHRLIQTGAEMEYLLQLELNEEDLRSLRAWMRATGTANNLRNYILRMRESQTRQAGS